MNNQIVPQPNGDFRVMPDHPVPDNTISFRINEPNPQEIIRIGPDGNIYWKGRQVESDSEFKEAMLDLKDAMIKAQHIHHE